MDCIKINQELKDLGVNSRIELWSPENEFIGVCENNAQLMDARLQIAEKNLSGYYLKIDYTNCENKNESVVCEINSNGSMKTWPKDLKNNVLDICTKIRRLQLDEN